MGVVRATRRRAAQVSSQIAIASLNFGHLLMRLLTQRQPAPDRQLHVIGDGTNSLLQDDWRPALIILGLLVAAVVHLMLRLRDIVARAEQTKAFVAHLHTRVNEQATQIQDLTADAA